MDSEGLFSQNVIQLDIEKEVKRSFLEYSMSVIVARAIPDVRDGLKPVHRRILYALHDQGMTHDKPHKKSANIVGEVMGKYHPHGDAAIYQTMVKLAQDFSMRYPMVDGHGNFGSIDGDAAAAMRYTESRMSKIAGEMLKDLEKETVDWRPTYDDSRKEPEVLPALVPNLLINGSSGIAVGMATNMAPHNLSEVVRGLIAVIDNSDITVDELMQIIPAPDFPTAGIVLSEGIRNAYATGRGTVKIRGSYEISEMKGGRSRIIINEIPYQVNKARLVEKIDELRSDRLEGIAEVRDESDRSGIRIVLELRRDANPQIVVNNLFKHTQLETSFGIINLALVDGEPRILTLKELLTHYIKHRQDVIVRRTHYELRIAEERLHILEGLKIALDHLDAIIALIRAARDRETARQELISQFALSEAQANAILDMRMVQLTGLERDKINQEYDNLVLRIADLNDILATPQRVLTIIKEDLAEMDQKYGDERRTRISYENADLLIEDFIEPHDVLITLSNRGYIKRQRLDGYTVQKRGGKGVSVAAARLEDFAIDVAVTDIFKDVLFFTNQGRVFSLKAYQIPESSRQAKGTAMVNLLDLRPDEKVTNLLWVSPSEENNYLMFATRQGKVKKVVISAFANIRKNGLIAVTLLPEDELVGVVKLQSDADQVMMMTHLGQAILFPTDQVRDMGRTAMGVKGITLNHADFVVGIDRVRPRAEAALVTLHGYGKRTDLNEFKEQKRGGKGLKTINIDPKNGSVVGFKIVTPEEELMILTNEGHVIRLYIDDISVQKRYSRGVLLMKTSPDDEVAALTRFKIDNED